MMKGKNVNAKVVKNVTKNKNMVKNLEREEGDLPPPRSWSGKDVKSFFKPRNKAKVRNYKPMKVIYAETGSMEDSEREETLKQKGIFNAAYDSNLFLRKKLKTRMEKKDMNAEQTEDQKDLGKIMENDVGNEIWNCLGPGGKASLCLGSTEHQKLKHKEMRKIAKGMLDEFWTKYNNYKEDTATDTWWDAITGDAGPDLREPDDRIGYLDYERRGGYRYRNVKYVRYYTDNVHEYGSATWQVRQREKELDEYDEDAEFWLKVHTEEDEREEKHCHWKGVATDENGEMIVINPKVKEEPNTDQSEGLWPCEACEKTLDEASTAWTLEGKTPHAWCELCVDEAAEKQLTKEKGSKLEEDKNEKHVGKEDDLNKDENAKTCMECDKELSEKDTWWTQEPGRLMCGRCSRGMQLETAHSERKQEPESEELDENDHGTEEDQAGDTEEGSPWPYRRDCPGCGEREDKCACICTKCLMIYCICNEHLKDEGNTEKEAELEKNEDTDTPCGKCGMYHDMQEEDGTKFESDPSESGWSSEFTDSEEWESEFTDDGSDEDYGYGDYEYTNCG